MNEYLKKKTKPIAIIVFSILLILSTIGQSYISYAEEDIENLHIDKDSYKITLEDTENGTLVFKDDENTREKEFKDEEEFNIIFKADEGYAIDNIVLNYKNGEQNTLLPTDEYNDIKLKALTDYTIKANFKKVDENVKKRTKRSASYGYVTSATQIRLNKTSLTWKFTVRANDGTLLDATCIQPTNIRIPQKGHEVDLYELNDYDPLKKCAYLGSSKYMTDEDYYVMGRAGAIVGGYEIHGYVRGEKVESLAERSQQNIRIPKGFVAYQVVPANQGQQMLAFSLAPPKGYIKVVKKSALPNITDGNKCYSLEGARYEVRNSSGSWVDTIVTDSNGVGYSNELDTGNYTVTEKNASKGYDLDKTKHSVSVTSDNSTKSTAVVVNSLEQPKNDPSIIEITKIFNGAKTPTIPSLEGTQFTINYYDGYYTESNLPSSPTRSWIVEVKKFGDKYITFLNSNTFVSGSQFYLSNNGKFVLPLGTISIQETKPAFGYTLKGFLKGSGKEISTTKPFVTQITETSRGVHIEAGNVYSGKNDPIYGSIELTKVDTYNKVLAGATFKLTNSKGQVVSEKTSDINGKIKWDNLYPDRYTVTEIKAPRGYQLLKQPIIIDVPSKYTNIQLNEAGISKASAKLNNGKYGDNLYYVWDMKHKVVNSKSFQPANTGYKEGIPYTKIATVVLVLSLIGLTYLSLKKKK